MSPLIPEANDRVDVATNDPFAVETVCHYNNVFYREPSIESDEGSVWRKIIRFKARSIRETLYCEAL